MQHEYADQVDMPRTKQLFSHNVNYTQGFTLPTVLLASVLMLAVLATALQLVSATSASLRDQYYNQLAREAAEAGVLHA